MSISTQLMDNFKGEISTIRVDKEADLAGQAAVEVKVGLMDGRTVTGTFTKESRPGFGGVQFTSNKDVVGLMTAKINSVLEGTYDRGQ